MAHNNMNLQCCVSTQEDHTYGNFAKSCLIFNHPLLYTAEHMTYIEANLHFILISKQDEISGPKFLLNRSCHS
jgi:hypothetical protein